MTQTQIAQQVAEHINKDLSYETYARQRAFQLELPLNKVALTKFDILEAFRECPTDIVQFMQDQLFPAEKCEQIKTLELDAHSYRKHLQKTAERNLKLQKLREIKEKKLEELKAKETLYRASKTKVRQNLDYLSVNKEVKACTRKQLVQKFTQRALRVGDLLKNQSCNISDTPWKQVTVSNISEKLEEAASRAEILVSNISAAKQDQKLVLNLGNEEIQRDVLGDQLRAQNKTYLMEKVVEQLSHLHAQMLNLADQSRQQEASSQNQPSRSMDFKSALEDKYVRQINDTFVKSQSLIAQTQRIKEECHSKFLGSLTDKQKSVMADAQEEYIQGVLTNILNKNNAKLLKLEQDLEYYKSVVNIEITPEFINEQTKWVSTNTKYLQAYSTVVLRIKQRTDQFVRQNNPNLIGEHLLIIPALSDSLREQFRWLVNETKEGGLIETMRRSHFLQKQFAEGTIPGFEYLQGTFADIKMREIQAQVSQIELPEDIYSFLKLIADKVKSVKRRHPREPDNSQQMALLRDLKVFNQDHWVSFRKALARHQIQIHLLATETRRMREQGIQQKRESNTTWQKSIIEKVRDVTGRSIADYHLKLFD